MERATGVVNSLKMQREQTSSLRDGALAATSLLFGIVPWGIVAGVAMVSAGLTQTQAVAMSVLVFAGTAQLAVLPLLVAKAPLWVIFATALIVNLRYFIYSAVLAPHFEHLSRPWRVLLSYITVDGVFALFVGRYRPGDGKPNKHWFYLGGSLLMWVAWQISSLTGIFAGALIPKEWSLEFAATLGLIALLIPLLFDRAVVCGALAAGVMALIAAQWPLNLGLLAAIVVGVAVGLAVARLDPRKEEGRA
ncbi:MAG TPA: AzlC family ABC transporter permease [Burkholderiales bacterium]|nr:AzlC family ABC transporter permease [Burkholderiales bacterium]